MPFVFAKGLNWGLYWYYQVDTANAPVHRIEYWLPLQMWHNKQLSLCLLDYLLFNNRDLFRELFLQLEYKVNR